MSLKFGHRTAISLVSFPVDDSTDIACDSVILVDA